MAMHAKSSPAMFVCVHAIPAFLLLSISQPTKADHPDFVSDIRQKTRRKKSLEKEIESWKDKANNSVFKVSHWTMEPNGVL